MKFSFIISPSAISQAIIEICEALLYVLHLKASQTLKCVLFKLFLFLKKQNQLIIIINLFHSNILHQVKTFTVGYFWKLGVQT
jgi:hypothetical protein